MHQELTLILEGNASRNDATRHFGRRDGRSNISWFPGNRFAFTRRRLQPSRPVGYVEGWYVAENHRNRGIGRKLLAAAEDWARSQGCVEIASDTWIENEVSQRVHKALGYEVVDRCVHYRKTL